MNFPLLTALRAATASLHQDVETKMNMLDPAMTEAAYFDKLAKLHAWSRALVASQPDDVPWDPELPTRLGWLTQDLAERKLATELTLPPFDADAWWGACYVVEGSSLGGQVLCKALGPRWPTRYFEGRGELTGKRWMAFLAALGRAEKTLDSRSVADGAVRAFAALLA